METNERALGQMKDTTVPAKWAIRLILLYFALYIVGYGMFFVAGLSINAFPDFYYAVMQNIEEIERAMLVLNFIIYLACGICFAIWTYRTHFNFKAFNERVFQENESSTAGWSYFIPFVNFYLPYKVVKENWDNFQYLLGKATGHVAQSSPYILPWWLFFITASIIERVGNRVFDKSDDNTLLMFVAVVLAIRLVAGILAIIMIRNFMRLEERVIEVSTMPVQAQISYDSLITE